MTKLQLAKLIYDSLSLREVDNSTIGRGYLNKQGLRDVTIDGNYNLMELAGIILTNLSPQE